MYFEKCVFQLYQVEHLEVGRWGVAFDRCGLAPGVGLIGGLAPLIGGAPAGGATQRFLTFKTASDTLKTNQIHSTSPLPQMQNLSKFYAKMLTVLSFVKL
jgi:hypothetical protein